MALTFEEVEDWTGRVGALESLQDDLSQRKTTLSGLQDQLAGIRRLPGWEGSAAHAARQSFDPVDDDIAEAAAAVGAVRTEVGETIADLTELGRTISETKQFAATNGIRSSSTAISSICGPSMTRPMPASGIAAPL